MASEERILLGHGGGGRLSRDLIEQEVVSRFGEGHLNGLPDGARLDVTSGQLVFSTDSFVVSPPVFPGGNIGHLAVHGTVNDVSVCGARPRWLSLSLILEEGLSLSLLREVLDTIRETAAACNVQVVTGDTKVVAAGECDGLYINTAGIGEMIAGFSMGLDRIQPGDVVLCSGTLGEHGMAVMASRSGIAFGDTLRSDTGSVHRLVGALAEIANEIRFMRDPTRGGAAAVLNEMVEGSGAGILLEEEDVPFSEGARAVSELTGVDLLHSASEGRVIAVCSPETAATVLDLWKQLPEGEGACRMGTVTHEEGRVLMNTLSGGVRLIDVPQGELLPRIC